MTNLELLVDADGVAHVPQRNPDGSLWVDEYGWFGTLCRRWNVGPVTQEVAITCIACLVIHE